MDHLEEAHRVLAEAAESLAFAADIQQITTVVAKAARRLCGADGTTFVLRDNGKCYYVDEDAISSLWKGKRFPMEACISGWCMLNAEIVLISDIYEDDRIPHDAYKPTFVKSLCMVPIRTASPMGAIGTYWAREYEPTYEEIKLLRSLANCAAVAIENWELREIISSKYKIEESLKKKQTELETAVHSLAHDLRGPLSTIVAFSGLLQTYLGEKLDERSNKYIDSILSTALRSSRSIEKILALYKLTNHEIKKQEVDLAIIAQELEAQIRSQNAKRNICFHIGQDLSVSGDPILMRLVIENLFSNAVKFSMQKEEAHIHFASEYSANKDRVFYVRDNGAGFESSDAEKLFQPKIRLHSDNEFQGTGLGLVSVARIIEAHGGSVRAEGIKGEGATFYFRLPA